MTIISLPVWVVKFFLSTTYGYTSMQLYQNGTRSLTNVLNTAISLAQKVDAISNNKVVAVKASRETYRVGEKQPEPGSTVTIVGSFYDSQYVGTDYQVAHVPGLKQQYQDNYPPFIYGDIDVTGADISSLLTILNRTFNSNRIGEQLTYDAGSFLLNPLGVTGKDLPSS